MKFAGAGPGPFGLLTELLALGIARGARGAGAGGASLCSCRRAFPGRPAPTSSTRCCSGASGWNLGIAWLADARPAAAADIAASTPRRPRRDRPRRRAACRTSTARRGTPTCSSLTGSSGRSTTTPASTSPARSAGALGFARAAGRASARRPRGRRRRSRPSTSRGSSPARRRTGIAAAAHRSRRPRATAARALRLCRGRRGAPAAGRRRAPRSGAADGRGGRRPARPGRRCGGRPRAAWVTKTQRGALLGADAGDEVEHLGAERRAERGEGLVEQQERPGAQERARQRHALALAAGELAGPARAEAGEADRGERRLDPRPAGAVEAEVGAEAEADVLRRRSGGRRGCAPGRAASAAARPAAAR